MITKYSEFLIEKVKFLFTFCEVVDGSYAPLQQLGPNSSVKSPLQLDVIRSLVELLRSSTGLHSLLLEQPRTIWNARIGAVLATVQEEFALISLLAHIIKIIKSIPQDKLSSEFPNGHFFANSLIEEFSISYNMCLKFFNTVRLIPELSERKDMIPYLPLGIEGFLKSIPVDAKMTLSDSINIFNCRSEIMGLRVPQCIRPPAYIPAATPMGEDAANMLIKTIKAPVILSSSPHNINMEEQKGEAEPSVNFRKVEPEPHSGDSNSPKVEEHKLIVEKKNSENEFFDCLSNPIIINEDQQSKNKEEVAPLDKIEEGGVRQIEEPKKFESVDLLGIEEINSPRNKIIQPANAIQYIVPGVFKSRIQNEPQLMTNQQNGKKESKGKQIDSLEKFINGGPEVPQVENSTNSIVTNILNEELGKNHTSFFIDMNEVKFENLIGSGGSAEVYKAKYRGTEVAVKKLKQISPTNAANVIKEFRREITALAMLRHPGLVLFMGAGITTEGNVCIITEFCGGGTVFKLLHVQRQVCLSWKQRCKIVLDVAKGMSFLHSYKPPFIHRDLKSLNLLLTEEVKGPTDYIQTKISDFGLTRFQNIDQHMTGNAGTYVRLFYKYQ